MQLEEKRHSLKQQKLQPPGSVDTSYDEDVEEVNIYEEDYMYYNQLSPSSGEEKVEIRADAEGVSATILNNEFLLLLLLLLLSFLIKLHRTQGDLTTTTTTTSLADSPSNIREGKVAAVAPTGDNKDLVKSQVAEVEATTLSGSKRGSRLLGQAL